jgi:hypothetical protein
LVWQFFIESEMARSSECTEQYAQKVLDWSRHCQRGDFSTIIGHTVEVTLKHLGNYSPCCGVPTLCKALYLPRLMMRLRRGAGLLIFAVLLPSGLSQKKPVVQFRSSCPKTKPKTPRLPTDISTLELDLRRTACFGSCPIYSIKINGRGFVTYEGRGWVKETGVHTSRISTVEVRRLVEQFISKGYFAFCGTYGAPSDLPGAITAIKWPGVRKTVINHGGFVGAIPKELFELEEAIDEVADSQQWVGRSTPLPQQQEQVPPPVLKIPPQPLPDVLTAQPSTQVAPH